MRHKPEMRSGSDAQQGPWLLVEGCDPNVWSFLITERRKTMGRSPDRDIVIPHLTISRSHAEIWRHESRVFICDVGSRNGVFVNDERITESAVDFGDKLRVGSVPLVLVTTLDGIVDATPVPSIKVKLPSAEALAHLTDGQRPVFDLLLLGLSEKAVAAQLRLSRHTVHIHIHHIYRAFGVHSRPELMARFRS